MCDPITALTVGATVAGIGTSIYGATQQSKAIKKTNRAYETADRNYAGVTMNDVWPNVDRLQNEQRANQAATEQRFDQNYNLYAPGLPQAQIDQSAEARAQRAMDLATSSVDEPLDNTTVIGDTMANRVSKAVEAARKRIEGGARLSAYGDRDLGMGIAMNRSATDIGTLQDASGGLRNVAGAYGAIQGVGRDQYDTALARAPGAGQAAGFRGDLATGLGSTLTAAGLGLMPMAGSQATKTVKGITTTPRLGGLY